MVARDDGQAVIGSDAPARTDTRARILEVAAELFATKGYAGTSVRDISEALGVTKAALYYHFASKEEILTEMLAFPLGRIREALAAGHDVRTPAGRKQLIVDVIAAIAVCDDYAVEVFRDPQVGHLIHSDQTVTGVVNQIAGLLAAGLSGVDSVLDARPQDVVKAAAAVAASHEAMKAWHCVTDDKSQWTVDDFESIASFAMLILES